MIEGLPPLRDYQREAIDDTFSRWESGATRVPLVLATGLGKSRVASELVDEWLAANPGRRALIIAHTVELIDQMAANMRNTGRKVGIVMGARNAPTAEIVVGSRQTLASERRRGQLKNVGLIIIDECHYAVRQNSYGQILEHFRAFDDDSPVKVLGLTATLSRSDKQKLSSIWEDCTFSRDIMFGIRNGYLLDVRGERVVVADLDMRNVRSRGGDWDERSLGEELERSFAIDTIAGEVKRLAGERRGLAFWPLVATAEHAARVFSDLGIPSGVVFGAQDKRERARTLAAHRAGDLLWVHNAMALTVGYDDPGVEVILMGRSTRSRSLYVQMAGRALRTPPGVPRALWEPALLIDVTGASAENDLALFIDLSPERALNDASERDPDATLAELDEIALAIEEELEEQRAGASFTFESDEYAGPVDTLAFDPLGRAKAWGRTSGGTFFLAASASERADSYVFIVESERERDRYDIVQCSNTLAIAPNGMVAPAWARGTEHRALTIESALLHGETLAGDAYNSRSARWRKAPASALAKRKAERLGIDPETFTNGGDLSDAIDRTIASRVIDPLVASVRARMQESDS